VRLPHEVLVPRNAVAQEADAVDARSSGDAHAYS
jgi:hypothetical protein